MILHRSLLGSAVKHFPVNKKSAFQCSLFESWSLWSLSVLQLRSYLHLFCLVFPPGALLRAVHKAQWDEVSGAVWWRSLPAPGGLPRPHRECDGAQGGLCLQAALRSLPAAVREQDTMKQDLCSVSTLLLVKFSVRKLRKSLFGLLQQFSVTKSISNSCYYDEILLKLKLDNFLWELKSSKARLLPCWWKTVFCTRP